MAELEKYQPSNGTEGEWFTSKWCAKCQRDRSQSEGISPDDCAPEELCGILTRTFAYDVNDKEYPVEWVYKDGRPVCTAFVPKGERVPEPRCDKTRDMFDDGG